MREGSDAARFGIECYLFHLKRGQIGVIIDTALGEQSHIFEAFVLVDDMVQVCVTFAADVLQRLDVEAKLGRVLGAAFGVDLALSDDWLEPGEVFAVMGDDKFDVLRLLCCD